MSFADVPSAISGINAALAAGTFDQATIDAANDLIVQMKQASQAAPAPYSAYGLAATSYDSLLAYYNLTFNTYKTVFGDCNRIVAFVFGPSNVVKFDTTSGANVALGVLIADAVTAITANPQFYSPTILAVATANAALLTPAYSALVSPPTRPATPSPAPVEAVPALLEAASQLVALLGT